jgi:hypothetical protein
MTVSEKLRRASRRMAFFTKAAVMLAPLSTILLFLFPDQVRAVGGAFSITAHYAELLANAVPLADRLIALGFAMIPTAIAMWGLLALMRLFEAFAAGDVFSAEALRALGNIAAALFWNVIATMATEPPISFFLSRAHALSHGSMQITLAADDAELLFLAGVAYVIARVMAEGKAVADEHAKFI